MPSLEGKKTELAVAKTGLPISSALLTVMSDQDFLPASGTKSASTSPAMMRFLCGKVYFSGLVSAGYSERTSPQFSMI